VDQVRNSGASLPAIEKSTAPGNAPTDDLSQLLQAAQDGDQLAWNEIVDRFSGLLWATCRAFRLSPSDAGDVCQLTWLRLLEHLASIRDPARLPGWLVTTCRRECLVLLRRNRRQQPVDDDRLLHLLGSDQVGAEQAAADVPLLIADRDAGLWQAFTRLSERCQQILRLLVVIPESGPPSYQLAAQALGLPTGSLGPTRGRCLAQLRDLLDAEGISSPLSDS
jgi:RNA polymerase sigma factor (sigma-70 family)